MSAKEMPNDWATLLRRWRGPDFVRGAGVIERGAGRPKDGYRLEDGTRVVSVTEVLDHIGSADPLLNHLRNRAQVAWENRASFKAAIWASHYEMKADGAHGTRVHEAIQATELGDGYAGDDEAVLDALRAWHAWRRDKGPKGGADLTIVGIEIRMRSSSMLLGGTCDFIAVDSKGRIWLIDLKTGNRLRGKHLLQLGMYSMLWDQADDGDEVTAHLRLWDRLCGAQVHGVIALHIPREQPGTWDADIREGKQLRRIEKAGRWAIQLVAALKGMDEQTKPRRKAA